MSTLPFEPQLTYSLPIHATGHLEHCDFCIEQEALSFAELLEYSRADVPGVGYFTDYYSMDRVSAARVEMIRERILALCKPTPLCRGCSESVAGGVYCAKCAREVESLIEKSSLELPRFCKHIDAGLGYVVVFLLFVFDLTAVLAIWPGL